MTSEKKPEHSPLGASSAERWMNCPGSNVLLKQLSLPETDEEDYRRDGIAAHEAAAHCIVNQLDAWEVVGEKFHDTEVTEEMANAIQMYLDVVKPMHHGRHMWFCEFKISDDSKPLFYGTVDFAEVNDDESLLTIVDYKHGEGIAVDAYQNPQLKYYARGMLEYHNHIRRVKMIIVQPRCWHEDGPIREYECTAEELLAWADEELFPAMERAEIDETLNPGKWCRFCPAKLYCPTLTGAFRGAATANPKMVPNLNDEALAREYETREAVKFYLKAIEDETYRRLVNGKNISTAKLVYKKADRVFKDGGVEALKAALGDEIYTSPEVKSPAAIEKINSTAKALVKEWAYMPRTGLTVAPHDDKRMTAPRPQTTAEAFGAAVAKIAEGDTMGTSGTVPTDAPGDGH